MAQGTIGGTPISSLPPSSFAYCEPGDGPVSQRCHFPIRDKNGKADAAHVRDAMGRMSQSPFGGKARAKIMAAAKECGIDMAGKAAFDMKAEPFTAKQTERWLAGERSRRVLVIPFGGPLPGGKAGLDLDGEYFDEETDIYGDLPALRASRWRFMDWHHDDAGVPGKTSGGPALSMKGMLIGEIELDEDPDEFGHWAQWWIKQGQSRQQLIAAKRVAALEQMGQPLYGSSQAVYKRKADDGHIEVWPVFRHTATTSPQNTLAVIPPLKGVLGDIPDDLSREALTALLAGLAYLEPDLRLTFPDAAADPFGIEGGDAVEKAGRVLAQAKEKRLRDALALALTQLVAELDEIVGAKEEPAVSEPQEMTEP